MQACFCSRMYVSAETSVASVRHYRIFEVIMVCNQKGGSHTHYSKQHFRKEKNQIETDNIRSVKLSEASSIMNKEWLIVELTRLSVS